MACPTFVRTQFLGAGIVRFDGRLGWGGQGGTGGKSELTVEVVEDKNCSTGSIAYTDYGWGSATTNDEDAFKPPEVGKPVEFHFNTFRYGGILNDWFEQDGTSSAKTYVVRLTDPTEILEGSQLICFGYTGETYYIPNLYNIYGWLEEEYGYVCPNWSGTLGPPAGFNSILRYTPATRYGGANDRAGLPWSDIYLALQSMTGGDETRFGGQIEYRGNKYFLDMSELPPLDPEIRFSQDHYSIYGLITEVCDLAQYDFHVELADKDIIAIRTSRRDVGSPDGGAHSIDISTGSEIDARLSQGVIGSAIASAKTSGEATSTQRGLELRSSYVNAFLTGDYRRDLWQISFMGGCTSDATIWPYWGADKYGNTIMAQGCEYSDSSGDHYFYIDVGDLGLPGLTRWRVDVVQMRAALASETAWRFYCHARDSTLQRSINFMSDAEMPNSGFLWEALRRGKIKSDDLVATIRQQMILAEQMQYYEPITRLWDRVKSYATTYMGSQFMVKLPYLCKKIYETEPWKYYTNWQKTEGAWVDTNDLSGGYILGLHRDSTPMALFKNDEGLIQGVIKFESPTLALNLSEVPERSYIQINPYIAYVRCSVREIIHDVGGNPSDSRAVVILEGPVHYMNNNIPVPDPLLLLWAINRKVNIGLSPQDVMQLAVNATMDKFYMNLPPLAALPVAAAVPLQSTINCYGPWSARIGDNETMDYSTAGKTSYTRDTSFSPWQFGSISRMNYAGDVRVATQLSDRYVSERGTITIADAPSVSLGDRLYAGGSEVSSVRVNFAAGTGDVTTDYEMALYTANYGRLGQYWVDAIKRAGQEAMNYRREYAKRSLERYFAWHDIVKRRWGFLYHSRMKRFQAQSSHTFIVAEHIEDPDNADWFRSIAGFGELTQIAPSLQAGSGHWYHKAGMELSGLLRPYSTLNTWSMASMETAGTPEWDDDYLLTNTMFYSKEQVPPIFCEEHHMPIVMETLNPFLHGTSFFGGQMTVSACDGHDIEYVVRDGVYPAHMNVRQAGYSESQAYRGVALKGPLVIAGWGFDINNKPVPNASPSYPYQAQMYFEDNWLRKPASWKCGPVDLRWDDRRKVWTSPSPFKIVRLTLCGPLLPGDCAHATMYSEDLQTTKDGSYLPWQSCCAGLIGNAKVTVSSSSHTPVPQGFNITAFYDTYSEMYHMLYHDSPLYIVQILTTMNAGSTGLGRIQGIMATGADRCQELIGRTVGLDNPLNQPLCAGQYAITSLRIISPTAYETWCNNTCPSDGFQWHLILQASFRPLCVVTWVNLIECPDSHEDPINCTLVEKTGEDNSKCYCYFEIRCDPIVDDWVEYDIIVKERQIWLESAWSVEGENPQNCYGDGSPGGQALGGSRGCPNLAIDCS